MPYPVYAQNLDKFIQDVYSSDLMCHNYFEIMEEAGLDTSNEEKMIGAIDSAGLDLARAILTGYVRQERFCDGLWASAVEDKVFLKLLKRMQQLATSG